MPRIRPAGIAAPTEEPRDERALTDESLAGERAKADAAFAEQAAVERKADDVLDRAREEADEVLATARDEADHKLDHPSRNAQVAIDEERAREDHALETLRANADGILREERAASARLLLRLLPLERNQTDQHLLTERARSDEALTHRDDFLGMVSHDLRDLLSGVLVNTLLIEKQSAADATGEKTRAAVDRIQRAAGRMNRLIGDLVDIAGIEAGKLAIVAARANVDDVLREAVETWESHASAKGVSLQARPAENIDGIFDRDRILQVLGNLVSNAIKFSPKGSSIRVEAECRESEVRFSVKDTGPGIPSDKLEAIFERFWQVGKNDRRGLGLGLYISRCLVEAHGGRIWAESTMGSGTEFLFTVPLHAEAPSR
jgi:signal transduction histidine kinase